ncbi:hypothetical protein [Polymorphospora rubra]|uniref:Uncharacterized protein n=1 Tax=Polymorphospora rubra TaxID=338584 RepID=A0A810N8W8_9ACTN|nr:hypothetical protein [Polymorphospora rubra]BCJ70291.1 hypothetical protein Prubr_73120 [Polymorphospora rubra]
MTGGAPLKKVGFYGTAEDVSAAARSAAHPWEPLAARYLEQGKAVVVSPGWVDDLLDGQARIIGQASILTDGTWIWPSHLAYYLRTYHVVLPEALLTHMISCDWGVPEIDDAELDAISEQLMPQYDVP